MGLTGKIITISDGKELTNSTGFVAKKELREYLKRDEINLVLNSMSPDKEYMLMKTMWLTGIRVSEICYLKKNDIDFENHRMKIRWLKNRKYNERIIPIKHELTQLLKFYTVNIKAEQKVFPYSRQWIFKIVRKYFPNAHPHTFRHSFAVNFLEQSKSAKALIVLKELLGHKHITTTMEYLRIVPNDLAQELENIIF